MGFLNKDMLSQFWLPSNAWFKTSFCLIRLLCLTFLYTSLSFIFLGKYLVLNPSLPLLCRCQDKQAKVQSDFTITILLFFQHLVSLFWGSHIWALTPLKTKWRSEVRWANRPAETPLGKTQPLRDYSAPRWVGRTGQWKARWPRTWRWCRNKMEPGV